MIRNDKRRNKLPRGGLLDDDDVPDTLYAHTVCECVRAGPGDKGGDDSRIRMICLYYMCAMCVCVRVFGCLFGCLFGCVFG